MADMHDTYVDSLRQKINNWLDTEVGRNSKWGRYIKHTPELFHLLIKMSGDKNICNDCKAKIATAVSYFISPFDFIPEEYWGALGYVDDIALAAYVIDAIIKDNDINKVKEYWTSEKDLQTLIAEILDVAEEMVGKEWWIKLKELVEE